MNIAGINRKLKAAYGGAVSAKMAGNSIVLEGSLSSWADVVSACQLAAKKNSSTHVVNDIAFTGAEIPKARMPKLQDDVLQGESPDVLIIGGGISGATIARELARYELSVLLIDKESDLAMGASGRNDGEVHPGVDLGKGSLKQHYVILGNKMYAKMCDELSVKFDRCGQYAGFTQGVLKPIVRLFAAQRRSIGVQNTVVISGEELRKREPNLSQNFKFALYDESAGCVSPYNLTIALAENAVENGVKVSLNTAVIDMTVENGEIVAVKTNRGEIKPKIVINASGVFAEDIAKMANDRFFSIHPRRGTNSILDKKAASLLHGIASIKESEKNKEHTKGGGVLHTVHGNVLVGPDAVETYEKENYATNASSIKKVFDKQRKTAEKLSERDIITYFTGVRAATYEEDFIVEWGRNTSNIFHVAGIQSPGLTAAPAIAVDVTKEVVKKLSEKREIKPNLSFNKKRKSFPVLSEMSSSERDRLIRENPDYGEIVCRCEEVSKGEILDALKSPVCVPTLDGIKKRVRPGMGRCQGGFCSPLVVKIISSYLGVPPEKVVKNSEDSAILFGETKEIK